MNGLLKKNFSKQKCLSEKLAAGAPAEPECLEHRQFHQHYASQQNSLHPVSLLSISWGLPKQPRGAGARSRALEATRGAEGLGAAQPQDQDATGEAARPPAAGVGSRNEARPWEGMGVVLHKIG